MENKEKKWHQKKIPIIIFVILIAVAFIVSTASSSPSPVIKSTVPTSPPATSTTPSSTPAQDTVSNTQSVDSSSNQNNTNNTLSNDNYYTNVNDTSVHDPAYSQNGEAPDGASAECSDGSYSFSQNHSGTCSHHGGVSEWLN
jgi:hypothetical protein